LDRKSEEKREDAERKQEIIQREYQQRMKNQSSKND